MKRARFTEEQIIGILKAATRSQGPRRRERNRTQHDSLGDPRSRRGPATGLLSLTPDLT